MCHKRKYLSIFILTYMTVVMICGECASLSGTVDNQWRRDVIDYLIEHRHSANSVEHFKGLLLESRLKFIHDIPKVNLTHMDFSKMDNYNANMKPSILQRDFYLDAQNRQLNYLHNLHFASIDSILELWPYDERQKSIKRISESPAILFYFNIEPTKNHIINNATLHLVLVNDEESRRTKKIDLQLYAITTNGRQLIRTQTFDISTHYHWADFDITSTVRQWTAGDSPNLGLELECQGCLEQDVYVSRFGTKNTDDHWALLNVKESFMERRRHRRSVDLYNKVRKARRTDCTTGNRKCCRHTMEVSFQELEGFDYIIQPLKFDAGYCKGRCPPRYNPASRHAILQSIMNKKDKSLAPRPCCAPSKLADLVVLHVDEKDSSKLKVSSWNDMRVVECACS